jgi:DNA-binding transcriptional ArsR family regulator
MNHITDLPHHHNGSNSQFIPDVPDTDTIGFVADAMKQLGDSSRLRIFWILCHTEDCVANIAALAGMTSPAVSHHLRLLKSSGLIVSRRDGKEMLYTAADTKLVNALHLIIEQLAEITCPSGADTPI